MYSVFLFFLRIWHKHPSCKSNHPTSQPSKPTIPISSSITYPPLRLSKAEKQTLEQSFAFYIIFLSLHMRRSSNLGPYIAHYPHISSNPIRSSLRWYDVPQMPCMKLMAFAHQLQISSSSIHNPQPTTQPPPADNLYTIYQYSTSLLLNPLISANYSKKQCPSASSRAA